MARPLLIAALAVALAATAARQLTGQSAAQKIEAEQRHDPYTKNAPEALQRLGYVSLGPFSWGRNYGTDHMTRTLGAQRMLWVETRHFKLGCDLAPRVLPGETRIRRQVAADLEGLRKLLPKVDPRNRKLDRWLLLHLYAFRLEKLYSQFLHDLGISEHEFPSGDGRRTSGTFMGEGPYLGQRGKFCVLLFDRREQLKRYLAAYAKVKTKETRPRRHLLKDSGSLVFATASDCFLGQLHGEVFMQNHVIGEVVKNFAEGYKSKMFDLPPWWLEGLSHWYRRQSNPRINLVDPEADPAEAAHRAWDWAAKVRARVKHEYYPYAEKLLAEKTTKDWGSQSHMMTWSRVDYLMQKDRGGLRRFLDALMEKPIPWQRLKKERLREWQAAAVQKAWGLSLDEFDEGWRKWVLSVYPK